MDPTAITYEKQLTNFQCGAAALCMVLRSLGQECTQEEVWPAIAPDRPGGGAPTHRLAKEGLRRGLSALIVKARDPWRLLRSSLDHGLRVVVNQQLRPGGGIRHFTVPLAVDDAGVLLHDPLLGPHLRRSREEFLDLWRPTLLSSIGHILVAFAPPRTPLLPCPKCQTPPIASMPCRRCAERVRLRPAAPLGCVDSACSERAWESVYCPSCDLAMNRLLPWPDEPPPESDETDP